MSFSSQLTNLLKPIDYFNRIYSDFYIMWLQYKIQSLYFRRLSLVYQQCLASFLIQTAMLAALKNPYKSAIKPKYVRSSTYTCTLNIWRYLSPIILPLAMSPHFRMLGQRFELLLNVYIVNMQQTEDYSRNYN